MWSTQLYQVQDDCSDHETTDSAEFIGKVPGGDNLFLNYVYGQMQVQFQHSLTRLDDDVSGAEQIFLMFLVI